jgi:hypothetical protein
MRGISWLAENRSASQEMILLHGVSKQAYIADTFFIHKFDKTV